VAVTDKSVAEAAEFRAEFLRGADLGERARSVAVDPFDECVQLQWLGRVNMMVDGKTALSI
jgi:hypothetical protein